MSFAEGFSDPAQESGAALLTRSALLKSNIWHRAFARWYDHRKAGHRIRAAVWGVIADAVAIVFWRPYR